MAFILNLFRRLRGEDDQKTRTSKVPKNSKAAVGTEDFGSGRMLASPAQLEKDEMFLSCVLATCSEARMREKKTLKYSKELAVKAIADLMGRAPCFKQPELVVAMALEALFQLSQMKPKLPLKLHPLVVHAAFAAVVEVKVEPDKQELEERYTLMLGGLLWEDPCHKVLNLLMKEVKEYLTSVIMAERQLAASSIGSLLSYAKVHPRLRNVLIPLELAHLLPKEDDIDLTIDFNYGDKPEN